MTETNKELNKKLIHKLRRAEGYHWGNRVFEFGEYRFLLVRSQYSTCVYDKGIGINNGQQIFRVSRGYIPRVLIEFKKWLSTSTYNEQQ